MITELNKQEIYNLLRGKLNFEVPYLLAEVGKELTAAGHGCRKYGFARMKNLMKELKDFIKLEDYEYEGHSNTNVILIPWKISQNTLEVNSLWAPTSAEMAELENEMGAGLLRINRNRLQIDKEKIKPIVQTEKINRRSEKLELTEEEKEKIYQILCGKFPKRQKLHMAKISKYLVERGFLPKNYGYSKMKNMLQEMPQYIELEDVIIQDVPNVLVTLLDKKETENRKEVEKSKQGDFSRLTYIPPKLNDYLKRKGFRNPEVVLAGAYRHGLAHNMVQARSYSITFPVHFLEEEMIAVLKKNEKPHGRPWYVSYVGSPKGEQGVEEDREDELSIPPGKSLEQFADLGYWQDFLKELAELALPEKWDSNNKEYGRYYILKKYIQYTFYRLLQENKISISADRKFAAFNTGLVNHHYDDIYACFVPNSQKGKEEWKFETFAIAGIRGKDGYGKLLTSYFNPLPPVPTYVEKNEDLIYDLNKDLLTDYEHIIIDNMRRLPQGYLRECCYGDDHALDLINDLDNPKSGSEAKKQVYTELSKYIATQDRIFRKMRSRMEDAIEIALKRVRWNFRTAIPCYFPKGNCMSLMLPLCLEDDSRTDAALVVQKNPSGSYQGQTVLRLEQAYLDARLVCRPNIDWLQTDAEGNV